MTENYLEEILGWRKDYQNTLLEDFGWLSIINLLWLTAGDYRIGSAESCDIRLPTGCPEVLGTLVVADTLTFTCTEGLTILYQQEVIRELRLGLGQSGNSELLVHGDIALSLIRRADELGIRIYHKKAESRLHFRGLNWFAIDPAYCVKATFTAYDKPRLVEVPNILGSTFEATIPGELKFSLAERNYRLLPTSSKNGLFIVFKDKTSSESTYPPGRFLQAELPQSDVLMLDFNKAYNPPCAFTPYATCPLPLPENHLDIAVLAGEKRYL